MPELGSIHHSRSTRAFPTDSLRLPSFRGICFSVGKVVSGSNRGVFRIYTRRRVLERGCTVLLGLKSSKAIIEHALSFYPLSYFTRARYKRFRNKTGDTCYLATVWFRDSSQSFDFKAASRSFTFHLLPVFFHDRTLNGIRNREVGERRS